MSMFPELKTMLLLKVAPETNIHSSVPADKDRGLQIPAIEVPDYFDYQENPDDEV